MKPRQIEISFDESAIRALVNSVPEWELNWDQIERIGYRTTANGPWEADYFLVLKTKDETPKYFDIALDLKGAQELAVHVNNMGNAKIPLSGILANCAAEQSVTVWPSENSGEPI
jgi:hypothetical protein